jgi:ketopantoate reductase
MSNLFRFGPVGGQEAHCYRKVLDLFAAADVEPDLKPEIIEWLWVHSAIAAGTIGAALFAGGQEALLADEKAVHELLVPAVREALVVLEARGVDPARWPDTEPYLKLPTDALVANTLKSAKTEWVQRTFRAGHFGENLEEMTRFYLDVLETGETLGVKTPCLSGMKEKIAGLS